MGILEKTKGITQIIEYEKPEEERDANQIFIWKHPCEDFNTMTQLIVHESQEAIFLERTGTGLVRTGQTYAGNPEHSLDKKDNELGNQ